MIRKFLEASDAGRDTVVFWGDGSPTREFLYVEDAADAFRLALERYDGPEPVNVGAGAEVPIHEVARLLAELTGYEGRVVWDASKPNGQPRRGLDISAARAKFGFEATTDLRSGLERTIAWYRSTRAADPDGRGVPPH
jgi:GDP-L-fucose synthase